MSNEAEAPAIQRRGLMLVLSSPSGAGKTTLSRQLLDNDKQIQLSVSCTTRAPRPGEKDGVDYSFIDAASFRGMIDRGDFLEHAEGVRPLLRHAARAGRRRRWRAAGTCCSTSTGRAPSSSRSRGATTW